MPTNPYAALPLGLKLITTNVRHSTARDIPQTPKGAKHSACPPNEWMANIIGAVLLRISM